MIAFYWHIECPECDADIYNGLNITTEEHEGRPVIPIAMAEQTVVHCGGCSADIYYGDLEYEVEAGDSDE